MHPAPGTRRDLLRLGALLALLGSALLAPLRAVAADWNAAAFGAKKLAELWPALKLAAPEPSRAVRLDAPDVAENGAEVVLTLASSANDTRELMLIVDGNPNPLALHLTLAAGVEPMVEARVKLAQSSTVRGVVRTADGRALQASRDVKVTIGSCAG
jgi:sulfur-oxidizing protein SoxY